MSENLRSVAAYAMAAILAASCVPADEPPDTQTGGVPIVGRDGSVVGTADPSELASLSEGDTVGVYDDGERVGSFSPDSGFTPANK